MKIISILSSVLFVFILVLQSVNVPVAHAADKYVRIDVSPNGITYVKPGGTYQLHVIGTLEDGKKVDLTKGSTGTKYQVVHSGDYSTWGDTDQTILPKFPSINSNGLVKIPPGAKDGSQGGIRVTNDGQEGTTSFRFIVKVPLKMKDISNSYAKADILQLEKTRVIDGYPDGTFRPHAIVTREEFATMLLRAARYPETLETYVPEPNNNPDYLDNQDKSKWYYLWVHNNLYVTAIKMNNGPSDSYFGVGKPMTRQDAVYSIVEAFFGGEEPGTPQSYQNFKDSSQIKSSYREEIRFAKYLGITKGYADGKFHPNDPVTRQEAAALINRTIIKRIRYVYKTAPEAPWVPFDYKNPWNNNIVENGE